MTNCHLFLFGLFRKKGRYPEIMNLYRCKEMFADVRIVNLSRESHTFRSKSFQFAKVVHWCCVEVAKIFVLDLSVSIKLQ